MLLEVRRNIMGNRQSWCTHSGGEKSVKSKFPFGDKLSQRQLDSCSSLTGDQMKVPTEKAVIKEPKLRTQDVNQPKVKITIC